MKTTESSQTRTGDVASAARQPENGIAEQAENKEKFAELRARLNAAMESARTAAQRLEEKTRAAAKATDECIRDHPYQTLGVAFGIGMLIGMLVARRSS
jgi:ElaB/YqjD/DUF883 family membrane-anchored ribosome-binding protein